MKQIDIKQGLKFKSTNFTMTAEVIDVWPDINTLSVLLTPITGTSWVEKNWNLQHTVWGFERGEYIAATPSNAIQSGDKEQIPKLDVDKTNGTFIVKELPGIVFGTVNGQFSHHVPELVKRVNEYDGLKAANTLLNEQLETGANQYAKSISENFDLNNQNKEMIELLRWVSKATNSPEIGIRCDKAISKNKVNQ